MASWINSLSNLITFNFKSKRGLRLSSALNARDLNLLTWLACLAGLREMMLLHHSGTGGKPRNFFHIRALEFLAGICSLVRNADLG
jgi:hypothetical protein